MRSGLFLLSVCSFDSLEKGFDWLGHLAAWLLIQWLLTVPQQAVVLEGLPQTLAQSQTPGAVPKHRPH